MMDAAAPNPSAISAIWQKQELRARMRALGRSMSLAQRMQESRSVVDLIARSPGFINARAVLLYAPLPDEADVAALVELGLQAGKIIALPRYNAVLGEYEAVATSVPLPSLPKGKFGVSEPSPERTAVDWKLLDFVVVPGLAFGRECLRLGRGRGFYDRLLAKARGIKCGAAFAHQVVETVPVEPHDMPLDMVAAPEGWIVSGRSGPLG